MPGSESRKTTLVTDRKGLAPGLPGIWGTALATLLVLVMLALLLWVVAVNAFGWFWPAAVWQVETLDGGEIVGAEVGRELVPGPEGDDEVFRLQFKVGNRHLDGRDFLWLDEADIRSKSRPEDLVRIVRSEYGDAFGRIVGAVTPAGTEVDTTNPVALTELLELGAEGRAEKSRLEEELSTVRRPLTVLEEELDLLERSANASTAAGQEKIEALSTLVDALATELRPDLDEIQSALDGAVEDLDGDQQQMQRGPANQHR